MEKVVFKVRAELNDVDDLARQFRMGTVAEVKDLGGMYNLNLLLATTTGKYVLRVYHPWATQQRLMQL
ncbi:MAG: hypothetical protein J2P36_39420 [Ktedonobacteraceae bacterium]|nr:hypothetical protein [Ktedonobacteraceae bacterium]